MINIIYNNCIVYFDFFLNYLLYTIYNTRTFPELFFFGIAT